MSRTKQSTRALIKRMYEKTEYGQDINEGTVTASKTFERKLNNFLKFMFKFYLDETYKAEKLQKESYKILAKTMLDSVRRYSLAKIEIWTSIKKWEDLYRFNEKNDINGKIEFVYDILVMLEEIYKQENKNVDLEKDSKIKKIKKSIGIYNSLEYQYNKYKRTKEVNTSEEKDSPQKQIEKLENIVKECEQKLSEEIRDEGERELEDRKLSALDDLEYLYEEVGNRQREKEVRNESCKIRGKGVKERIRRKHAENN